MANISMRVADETKAEFQEFARQAGVTREDFVSTLLLAYKEKQLEAETGTPAQSREMTRIRTSLANVEKVIGATLELSTNDLLKVKEESLIATKKAQEKLSKKITECAGQVELLDEQTKQIDEQEKQIDSLRQNAENIASLKEAWAAREANLTNRISELDAEAKEARALKESVSNIKEKLLVIEHEKSDLFLKNDIQENKIEQLEKDNTDVREEWKTTTEELKTAKTKLSAAEIAIEKKEVNLLKAHSDELQNLHATYKKDILNINMLKDTATEKYENQIAELNNDIKKLLADQKKAGKPKK